MSLRRLLLRYLCHNPPSFAAAAAAKPQLYSPSRSMAFSSAEEAAAERRRRKRRLRIEPPLHALRRDPSAPRPQRDPNAPRLPDTTSSLVGNRLNLHNRVQSLIRAGELDTASATCRHAVFSSVRPTVFTCNAISSAMLRERRHEDVSNLHTFFFVQCNLVPNVVSYNILINSHCDAKRLDEAMNVYHHLLANAPFSPSATTFRHLTKGFVVAGQIDRAMEILREMFNRGQGADTQVYNNLISGYIELGDMDKAVELFDELRERCPGYDCVVLGTFMKAYFKKGMDKEAMDYYQHFLERRLNRQIRVTAATCNGLMEVFLENNKANDAEELFQFMMENHTPPNHTGINTDTYNVLVNDRCDKGEFFEAIEAFHRRPAKPVQMDVGCFNNIMEKLAKKCLMDDAEKLFEEMPTRSVIADVKSYKIMVEGFLKAARAENAMSYFEKLLEGGDGTPKIVSVTFFNIVLQGLSDLGLHDRAISIFRRMGEKDVRPNPESFEILIRGLVRTGDLDQALVLLLEMTQGRMVGSSEFREVVRDAFEMAGRREEIEAAFGKRNGCAAPQC